MVHCKLCFLLAWVIGSLWMPLALAQQPAGLLDARTRLLEAETRQAIAEAERAELLARLPPAQAKPLPGAIVTRQFGAAGLARAFDLALELAAEVCAALPPDRPTLLYDPAAIQGMVAARAVEGALVRLGEDLAARNRELALYIEAHSPAEGAPRVLPLAWLAVPPAILRAAADLAALFKGDTTWPASATARARAPCSPAPWRAAARRGWRAWAAATWANWTGHATSACWEGCAS